MHFEIYKRHGRNRNTFNSITCECITETAGGIQHMHEDTRTLDVAQEVMAEACALCRTLDEAGDIGEHERALIAR